MNETLIYLITHAAVAAATYYLTVGLPQGGSAARKSPLDALLEAAAVKHPWIRPAVDIFEKAEADGQFEKFLQAALASRQPVPPATK